jgi:hypothetical protein
MLGAIHIYLVCVKRARFMMLVVCVNKIITRSTLVQKPSTLSTCPALLFRDLRLYFGQDLCSFKFQIFFVVIDIDNR